MLNVMLYNVMLYNFVTNIIELFKKEDKHITLNYIKIYSVL